MAKVLLVDRSGRGHAYADLLVRTNPGVRVIYAPGCSAIGHPRITSLPDLNLADAEPFVAFAARERIDLVLVANTLALAAGFVDAFRDAGIPVIGPDREACQLETSKIYGKRLCQKYDIPTAEFECFDDPDQAVAFVERADRPLVVKADGLCGGNGTFVCDTAADAVRAIDQLMRKQACGQAGSRVVIERRLEGREVSVFALVAGTEFQVLPMALDYPKSDDGNAGITCGGVGAISPHPLEEDSALRVQRERLVRSVVKSINSEGLRYTGVIYLGCMWTESGLKVLEINVRLGDPEAEVVLPRITSDFFGLCEGILTGHMTRHSLRLNALTYCDVVATQGRTRQMVRGRSKGWYVGWPYGRYGRHNPITGLDQIAGDHCRVFLGEVFGDPDRGPVSDGGRVLHVVGFGHSSVEAASHAYSNIEKIHFDGIRYRTDIGQVWPWETPVRDNRLVLA